MKVPSQYCFLKACENDIALMMAKLTSECVGIYRIITCIVVNYFIITVQ